MIFSICSLMHFWLSLLCSGIPRLTLVDCITWNRSLEDQFGSWEVLAGGGAVGRERCWVLLRYPTATFLAAFCGWCPAGFHSFLTQSWPHPVPPALGVLIAHCCCQCLVLQDSHLLPYLCPFSFQQSFYKIFLFLFWTVCGELGFPDEYHCLTGMLLYGW